MMQLYPLFLNLGCYPLLNAHLKGIWKIFCRCQDTICFRCGKAEFYNKKRLAMLNVSNAQRKKRWGVSASCSILLCYFHQVRLIFDRCPNKGNYDVLDGSIITRREVITVARREQLYIFMKHADFGDYEFHLV